MAMSQPILKGELFIYDRSSERKFAHIFQSRLTSAATLFNGNSGTQNGFAESSS